jgi:hypothetical protein
VRQAVSGASEYRQQRGVQQRLILNVTDLRKQIVGLFGPYVRKLYDLLE